MGSYDNIVKIEEMRKHMEEGNIQAALLILDTMETRKIKNMSDLSLIAEVYAQNERYEEAEKLLHKIYEKTKSRKSLYQLLDVSIKNNNVEEAQQYLEEYKKLAPKDFYKYIFQYKIDKLKGAPYEMLISTLMAGSIPKEKPASLHKPDTAVYLTLFP
jgi:tetratricopeptide (TPR) repeat protein